MGINSLVFLFYVFWPPILLQFIYNVVPILHGESSFSSHHDGHGDVVIGTIDVRVPKAITEIEGMATLALLYVLQTCVGLSMSRTQV